MLLVWMGFIIAVIVSTTSATATHSHGSVLRFDAPVSLSPLHSRIVCLEFYHSLSLTITAAIVSDICNVGWT